MQLIKHNQQPPHNCQQPIATTTQPPSSSTTQNIIQNKPIAHQHQIGSPTTTTTTSTTNPDKPITSTPLPTPTSKPKTFIIQVNPDSKPTIFIAVWHTKHQNIICSKSYKICNMLFGTFSTSSVDALMNIDMTRRERYLCNLKQSLFQKKKKITPTASDLRLRVWHSGYLIWYLFLFGYGSSVTRIDDTVCVSVRFLAPSLIECIVPLMNEAWFNAPQLL